MPRKNYNPKIITLDTETIGLDGGLRRIAIYDGGKVTYGYSFKDILPELDRLYNDGFFPHIYIHNADFDLRKLPEIFEKGNVRWNTTRKINNKYGKLTCNRYTIHDSLMIFPMSLSKISKDFGLEHGKLDLWDAVKKKYPGKYTDHVDFLNRCDVEDSLYLEYLGYDVISLYEAIEKIMSIAKMSVEDFVKIISTASLSRYLFKNGWGDKQFKSSHSGKSDYELLTSCKAWSSKKQMKNTTISYLECEYKIRQAFCGGRTEVFTPVCANKGYHYDVNSLYPYAMLNDFPIGYPEYIADEVLAANCWKRWLYNKRGLGFIECELYIPQQAIPPLPLKIGKLAFVTGHVKGTWTFTELEYAIRNCHVEIIKIIEVIYFKRTYPVFTRFVTAFYELKEQATKEKNVSLRAFAKLILNTAYGWTGLKRTGKTCLRDVEKLEDWRIKAPERILTVNNELGYIELIDEINSDTVQVAIAAYVTSYARLVLLDALREQASKGAVYYCDTDSIICGAEMDKEKVDTTRLGAWDLEKIIDGGIFIQPKVYTEKICGKAEIKFKGITKKRQKELDSDFYQEILNKLRRGERGKIIVEKGRQSLPTLAVSQKKGENPNIFKTIDKGMNLDGKQKRDIDYTSNFSQSWHMESLEEFNNFNFKEFNRPPGSSNLFGG